MNSQCLVAYSMLTRDGRRLISRMENGEKVFSLVPVTELPADLPPVRKWTVYGVKSAHSDLGLHEANYVQRQGSVHRLEKVGELLKNDSATSDDPAAFRYCVEGWWGWFNFIKDKGESAGRELAEYFARKRLDVGSYCCGGTTHIFGYEELCRALYPLKELREKWGLRSHTLPLVDNPGISWAVVQPYADAGIENLCLWPNNYGPTEIGGDNKFSFANGSPDRPPAFWWESPDGARRLLVFSGTGYIGGGTVGLSTAFICPRSHPFPEKAEIPPADWKPNFTRWEQTTAEFLAAKEKAYPFDVWLYPDYHDDEEPSRRLADAYREWNRKWLWPQFRTVGDFDEPFNRLRKFADAIPVVRGDISCAWDRFLPAVAGVLAEKLAADRALPQAETLSTLAALIKGAPYPQDEFNRAYEALVMNDDHSYGMSGYSGRRVYDTWAQHLDWIRTAAATAGKYRESARRLLDAESRPAEPVPADTVSGIHENRWYRIAVEDNGEITSIFDKELNRELLDAPANRLFYTRDAYKSWSPADALGAEIRSMVTLDSAIKAIHIDNTISHARDLYARHKFYGFGHYAFPFRIAAPRFVSQLNGPAVDAHSGITGHVSDTFACIRDWCAVENADFGIALFQRDTAVVEYGKIHGAQAYARLGRPAEGHVYSFAFADGLQWHISGGDEEYFRFRYTITSYRGNWQSARLPHLAGDLLHPDRKIIAQYINTGADNAELVTLKRAEDGNGIIARLRETSGRPAEARPAITGIGEARFMRCDILENIIAELPGGKVRLEPFAFATVRIIPENWRDFSLVVPDEPWTGLLTRPAAFAGANDGEICLLWMADRTPDFSHYELYRGGNESFSPTPQTLIAEVKNETESGILYANARYTDCGLARRKRYYYRLRPVYADGHRGDFSAVFSGRTREITG